LFSIQRSPSVANSPHRAVLSERKKLPLRYRCVIAPTQAPFDTAQLSGNGSQAPANAAAARTRRCPRARPETARGLPTEQGSGPSPEVQNGRNDNATRPPELLSWRGNLLRTLSTPSCCSLVMHGLKSPAASLSQYAMANVAMALFCTGCGTFPRRRQSIVAVCSVFGQPPGPASSRGCAVFFPLRLTPRIPFSSESRFVLAYLGSVASWSTPP
jgi:hypothetical protein